MPLSAVWSVRGRAGVTAADSEGREEVLRSFAGRLPMSRTRSECRPEATTQVARAIQGFRSLLPPAFSN